MSLGTPAARRDLAYHLHPSTNLRQVRTEGPLVITRGEGVYVYDDEGRPIGTRTVDLRSKGSNPSSRGVIFMY